MRLLVLVVLGLFCQGWARMETESHVEAQSQLATLAQHSTEAAAAHVNVITAINKAEQAFRMGGISSPDCAIALIEARKAATKAATSSRNLKQSLSLATKLSAQVPPAERQTWREIVSQSRALVSRTDKIKDALQRQLAQYLDESDVEGRKYNGWASIWDELKGIKPAKHWSDRAREIEKDVINIMRPAEAQAVADTAYGGVARVMKAADDTFATKFTRHIGNPALGLLINGPKVDEVISPPTGAHVQMVGHDPTKPYVPEATTVTWKDLQQIPELSSSYSPIYVSQMKKNMEDRIPEKREIPAYDPIWRTKNIPYTYPVRVIETNPKIGNPHIKSRKSLQNLPQRPETLDTPAERSPARPRTVVTNFVKKLVLNTPPKKDNTPKFVQPQYLESARARGPPVQHIEPQYAKEKAK